MIFLTQLRKALTKFSSSPQEMSRVTLRNTNNTLIQIMFTNNIIIRIIQVPISIVFVE